MKKIILTICIAFIGITAYAKSVSESKVPVLVKHAFYQSYPEAEHVKWEVTEFNDYRASYRMYNEYGSVYYNDKGAFIESDISIRWREVPLTGRMEIYHLNKKGRVRGVLKIVNSQQQEFYLMNVASGLRHYEVLLDHEGNIIK